MPLLIASGVCLNKLSHSHNEQKRLEILKSYDLLDSAPEKLYDNITLLASQICRTPIALVSLVDKNRQWFKSNIGMEVSETPRENSFCDHAISENDGFFQITNAKKDARFKDDPQVTGNSPFIFYAGATLTTPGGENIGTLCVIDHVPRTLTSEQSTSLRALAAQVVALFELRLSSQQLSTEKNNLAEALESMSDGFISIDHNWIINYVNQELERIVSKSRHQLLGTNLLEIFFSNDEQRKTINWSEYHRTMFDRVPAHFEGYNSDLKIWVKVKVYPKKDGGLAIFFTDVSETRAAKIALRTVEANFQAITEATPSIVWTATADGAVEYANQKWYDYSGLSEKETLGRGFFAIIHPEDAENSLRKYTEVLQTLQPFEIEHRFRRAFDGQYRWFLTRALPSMDDTGKVIRWFGTDVDIHDQKSIEVELVEAKAQADHANQAKSSFLANMSHEIRTPLGAILGFTDLLKERELHPDDRQQYLDTISRNGKALTRIIDDILDLAKVESGKLEIEKIEFSLFDLMDEVTDIFRERTKAKGIYLRAHIEKNVPARIISDPTRLRQIFINIVGNAVKFTEKGGVQIEVQVKNQNAKFAEFVIEVRDSGIGLTAEQRTHLFKPFVQADNSTSRKFGGTGLGLALSRRLAKALNGDITIENLLQQQGCTFRISFNADLAVPETAQPRVAETIFGKDVETNLKLRGIHILLADDSSDNQFLVSHMLSKHGAIVDTADNGLEAYRKAIKGGFDLVLMDIQMPVMDGYESTRNLREAGFKKPIVALTAHAMAEERARTKAAGCSGHLTKPLDQVELVNTIMNLVK